MIIWIWNRDNKTFKNNKRYWNKNSIGGFKSGLEEAEQ